MNLQDHFELHWLREEPGGALSGHQPRIVQCLSELPINETLIARIRRVAPPSEELVRLHLPYLTLRDRSHWHARQLELRVARRADGSIMVGDATEDQFSRLLTGGTPPPFSYQDERAWNPSDWSTAVRPMLAAHGLPQSLDWKPAGPLRVRWCLTLPAEFSGAWVRVAHRRDGEFLDQFRGVSSAVQRALRLWLPYLYFHDPARYLKADYANAYMVHAGLPLHPSRRKTQLAFHILEPDKVLRSLRRASRPLAEHFTRAAARLSAAGLPVDERFRAAAVPGVMQEMRKMPRVFAALLALESFLVEECVQFASIAYDIARLPDVLARQRCTPGLDLLHQFRCRLSRSYGGENYRRQANLVLVAAMVGLCRQENARIHACVRIVDEAAGRSCTWTAPVTYARV